MLVAYSVSSVPYSLDQSHLVECYLKDLVNEHLPVSSSDQRYWRPMIHVECHLLIQKQAADPENPEQDIQEN